MGESYLFARCANKTGRTCSGAIENGAPHKAGAPFSMVPMTGFEPVREVSPIGF